MWNTNLPTAWLWVDKDKQGLGASHWGNLKKTMQIWKWKNNQNQYFQILTWKDPGPISGGSTRSLAFSRQTERCLRWKRKKVNLEKNSQKITCPALLGRLLLEAEHGAGNLTLIWQISLDFTQECAHTRLSRLPNPKTQCFHFYPLLSFFQLLKSAFYIPLFLGD